MPYEKTDLKALTERFNRATKDNIDDIEKEIVDYLKAQARHIKNPTKDDDKKSSLNMDEIRDAILARTNGSIRVFGFKGEKSHPVIQKIVERIGKVSLEKYESIEFLVDLVEELGEIKPNTTKTPHDKPKNS